MFKILPIKKSDEIAAQGDIMTRIEPMKTEEPPPIFTVPPAPQAAPAIRPDAVSNAEITPRYDISLSPLERAQKQYETEIMTPAEKQSPAKQALFIALQAVGNTFSGQNKPIEFLGNAKKRMRVEQAGQELGALQQQRQIQQQAELNDARIADIPFDSETARLRAEELREARKARLQGGALAKLNTLKVYDPKNAAQRRLAEQAGLDPDSVGAWDTRNPVEHSINGVRFRLNRETGKYEQTDLPIDEEKQLVDFTTKDGKKYRVSAKTAATLQTQFDTLGMRQEFQSRENQLDREQQIRLREIEQAQRIQLETIKSANDAIQKSADAATKAQAEETKRRATEEYNNLRNERLRLQNQKLSQEIQ